MKTSNLSIVKTQLPKKGAFTIDTEPNFPKLHQLMVVNGKRGSGKTVAITNFLKVCKAKNYIDIIFLITPTYISNKQIWDICDIQPEDVYEVEKGVIKEVIEKVNSLKEEWDEFVKAKALYLKYKRDKNKEFIPDDLILEYSKFDFFQKKPTWRFPVEQPPRVAVLLDDCLSTEVMARPSEGLTNLAIKHRHIADGLGISLILLTQTYCGVNGISRIIRENVCSLCLFAIHDENQIKKIFIEMDLKMEFSKFQEMLDFCHKEPHQFLFIDFNPKTEKHRFRKGWNEILI